MSHKHSYRARENDRARSSILGAMHDALRGTDRSIPYPDRLDITDSMPSASMQEPIVDRFVDSATSAGARCVRAKSGVELATIVQDALRTYHPEHSGTARVRVGVSDAALTASALDAIDRHSIDLFTVGALTRDELFSLDVGITSVRWGIAETGTLVLDTAVERNRLLSLVPSFHIALVPASAIRGTLAQVLGELHGSGEVEGPALPRGAVTFITGPSRTSDIELTLVVGVHGPQELLIVVVD